MLSCGRTQHHRRPSWKILTAKIYPSWALPGMASEQSWETAVPERQAKDRFGNPFQCFTVLTTKETLMFNLSPFHCFCGVFCWSLSRANESRQATLQVLYTASLFIHTGLLYALLRAKSTVSTASSLAALLPNNSSRITGISDCLLITKYSILHLTCILFQTSLFKIN